MLQVADGQDVEVENGLPAYAHRARSRRLQAMLKGDSVNNTFY